MNRKVCSIFSLLLTLFSSLAFARSWPVFEVPERHFLMTRGYLQTKGCPVGQAKLVDGAKIDMMYFCSSWCPESWAWETKSDGECHPLSEFKFQRLDFVYFPDTHDDDDGKVLYTKITANYGKPGKNEPTFQLVFTSPPEHWYCIVTGPELVKSITCANDI